MTWLRKLRWWLRTGTWPERIYRTGDGCLVVHLPTVTLSAEEAHEVFDGKVNEANGGCLRCRGE